VPANDDVDWTLAWLLDPDHAAERIVDVPASGIYGNAAVTKRLPGVRRENAGVGRQ
jgi:hypothetical protein